MNGHTQSGIYDLAQTLSGEIIKTGQKESARSQIDYYILFIVCFFYFSFIALIIECKHVCVNKAPLN